MKRSLQIASLRSFERFEIITLQVSRSQILKCAEKIQNRSLETLPLSNPHLVASTMVFRRFVTSFGEITVLYRLTVTFLETYSMTLDDDVSDSSRGLTTVPPLFHGTPTNISVTLNKQTADRKHEVSLSREEYEANGGIHFRMFDENFGRYRNRNVTSAFDDPKTRINRNNKKYRNGTFAAASTLKFLFDPMAGEEKWSRRVFNERLQKRNPADKNDNARTVLSKGKQKKAKALGRLLLKNDSVMKHHEDIQDDYVEDEDDDYSKGVNKKKMNWEDYQNEDGASVMELIALNARHKKHKRRAHKEYLY